MKKILIVDDHEDIRRLLVLMLEQEYEVLEASNGIEALQVTQRERPFAILLDIMMPGEIDGLQVLSTIKTDPRLQKIKVAMVTARGQRSDFQLGEKYGADGYFVKPFSPLQIITWLHKQASLTESRQDA
jgi:CheY-like chemotaxis protein